MPDPSKFDVIIVGAGPAGSSAGYQLAGCGQSVCILDRHDFPRVKPCAGGVTLKALQILPYSIEPVIQRRFSAMSVGNGNGPRRLLAASREVCAMTERAELDHFCLKQAQKAGAEFRRISSLDEIVADANGVKVRTSGGILEANFLIGADGVNSTVRRLTGLFPEMRKGVAVEAKVKVDDPGRYEMAFDFFKVSWGYGWVFPKGDHLNIGLGTMASDVKVDRQGLTRYAAAIGVGEYTDFVGHHLAFGGQNYKVGPGRVFLTGDAAGFTDPLLGEGIYYAIRGGQLVAEAIVSGKGDPARTASAYDSLLEELRRDVGICYSTAKRFYNHPKLGFAALTLPVLKGYVMKGVAKGMTVGEVVTGVHRLPFMNWNVVRGSVNLTALGATRST